MYGPPCYVNDHAWVKKNKMTCAIMTNLACGSNVDMCMYGVVTWILGNELYDLVTCKF
jgi:hypothetical protein